MESYQNNRLVRKFFKCTKCKEIEGKLVNPFANNIYCSKCSTLLNEISESNYKKAKNKLKQKQKEKEDIKEVNNQMPYKPSEELLKKASNKYNKDRPSSKNIQKNKKYKNDDKSSKHSKVKKSNRHQSTTHYSNINFNNINNNNNNNHNYNNNQYNNINHINIINDNDQNRQERREHHRHGGRRRDHSMDPNQNSTNNFFSDFFRGIGFQPFINFEFSIETPFMNNNRHNHNPFRITVQRQNVSNDIFDPIFSTFGAIFNGAFQDNFSSNFSSNYRGNFFDEIIRILERNQAEAKKNAHPPASEESLQKLKKFSMNEKYCKKDKKGKLEFPNCCICLSEIERGEKTVLLPCGHMFHWKCCLTWLKSNNTCPMCRFEIK
jgi:hypothetical protein